MTVPLSPTERRKLVAILGMMGSDHDGERAAAAALASRIVRAAGLDWDALISTAPAPQQQASGRAQDGAGSRWQDSDDIAVCLKWLGHLSVWETRFVTDLRAKRRPLSAGQRAKLQEVAASLRARGFT